jgi:xanthine dehydrogenase accessory factor
MSGPGDLARLAREALAAGEHGLLAEIVSVEGSHYRREGARMVLTEGGRSAGAISGGCLEADLARRLPEVCAGGGPVAVEYDMRAAGDAVWGLGLGCNGRVTIRLLPLDDAVLADLESVASSLSLLICGAGPDALPLARLGVLLGWLVHVVAPRPTDAARERFAGVAPEGLQAPADLGCLANRPGAATVVMTHNFLDDLDLLRRLELLPLVYLGVLGPRERTRRLEARLHKDGIALFSCPLHAPAGLDIGADSPEEIALAIAAEIQAVVTGRRAGFLQERPGSIHGSTGETIEWRSFASGRQA